MSIPAKKTRLLITHICILAYTTVLTVALWPISTQCMYPYKKTTPLQFDILRVPRVMESQGKSWTIKLSGKVMESYEMLTRPRKSWQMVEKIH